MIPGYYPAITSSGDVMVFGTSSGVIISPVLATSSYFTIVVNDGTQSNSATASVTGIYPYFYGFSTLDVMNNAGLSSLIKLVEPREDKYLDITGNGNLYFIHDSNYGKLSNIYDENGDNKMSHFDQTVLTLSSPSGYWASKVFNVYQWNGAGQFGPPSVNYHFEY